MFRHPRVSVLLPVFDAAATLAACLRSIRRQTCTDWHCVAVDDGSRDASLSIARRAALEDPRFEVLALRHGGLVPALQAGLARCRGEVVVRMDADDLMHRRRVELQLEALDAHPDWCAVGSHVRCFPRAALGEGMRAYEAWLGSIDSPQRLRREVLVECPVAHPTLAIRASALRALGYRDQGWPEDYDLVLRLLESGREIGMVPRRLLAWRHGPGRLSRTASAYTPERFTACKAAFLARTFLADSEHYVLWGYGGTGRALRRALSGHGRRRSAIIELHPGRLGQRIHGAPVVPPEALPSLHRAPLVVSVAGLPARERIRAALRDMQRREGVDFLCAA